MGVKELKAIGAKIGVAVLNGVEFVLKEHPEGYIVVADKNDIKVTHSDSVKGLESAGYQVKLDPVAEAGDPLKAAQAENADLRKHNDALTLRVKNLEGQIEKVKAGVPEGDPAPGASTKTAGGN